MQTAAIGHRVADFLKQYSPFQSMDLEDLLALVARGRVKFHEADEYVCWQGTAHTPFVFVIQQGTVSLWEQSDGRERLRDIRGAGDMLGIERYLGSETALYSAKTTSDVVLYALHAQDFEPLLTKYPDAERFLAAHASVSTDYEAPGQRPGAHEIFLYDAVREQEPLTCAASDSIRDAALKMSGRGARAIAVVEGEGHVAGVLTSDSLVRWIAEGGADAGAPVSTVMDRTPSTIAPEATAGQAVVTMAEAGTDVAAITRNGTADGTLHGLVTARELTPVFGDQPASILREIMYASNPETLARLNQRTRFLVLEQLASPAAMSWLANFSHRVDLSILQRVATWNAPPPGGYCWCFFGASGRRESLTAVMPASAVIVADRGTAGAFVNWRGRLMEALGECGYLPQGSSDFDGEFLCASVEEWKERFCGWVEMPVLHDINAARPLFDLHPVLGNVELWSLLEADVRAAVRAEPSFVRILAHDCLGNLPPLTFYRDLVVEGSGKHTETFHLERNALRPLVDVGRVFGIAAGRVIGGTSHDRFAVARRLLPERESIFREAAETLTFVLYHQTSAGIRQRGDGYQLPPSMLSHHDRQVLKSGFRSILRLLEFTAEGKWAEAI